MGYQQHHHGGNNNSSGDGVSHHQRVNSPRYAGSMTRRAHSFKRGGNGEIELQINSPRSPGENPGSPAGEGAELPAAVERWQGGGHLHHNQNVRLGVPLLGKGLFKKHPGGAAELGFRESRRIKNLLFFAFCSACFLLGIVKICAGGWLGLPGIKKSGRYQVRPHS